MRKKEKETKKVRERADMCRRVKEDSEKEGERGKESERELTCVRE